MILRLFFAQIVLIAAQTGTVLRHNRYSAGDPVHAAITNFYFVKAMTQKFGLTATLHNLNTKSQLIFFWKSMEFNQSRTSLDLFRCTVFIFEYVVIKYLGKKIMLWLGSFSSLNITRYCDVFLTKLSIRSATVCEYLIGRLFFSRQLKARRVPVHAARG